MSKHVRMVLALLMLTAPLWDVCAQSRRISGTVVSVSDELPLPGVNVTVKGTTQGTITDVEGRYVLEVPADAETLVFSFVGYESQDIPINNRTVLDVSLQEDIAQLTEVVVTANAIERERRDLGYSVATVEGENLTRARDPNVLSTLAGRVAGVRVQSQSGTPGGSVRVQIRGAKSLGASPSEPLFVVDGMPINNSSYGGTRSDVINGGNDWGNRVGDLNADDIASVSVLKGSAAAALYGSRAANGAVIITTKRGRKGTKAQVSVNSTVRFDNVLKLPDLQNEYAPGNFGLYDDNLAAGWGPRISDVQNQRFLDYKGDSIQLRAYPDNLRDFFQTGRTLLNNVAISGANDAINYRFSYTNTDQKGVIPYSGLKRNNFSLNAGGKLSDKISTQATVQYIRTEAFGRPRQGSNDPNILISSLYLLPRTYDMQELRDNQFDENGEPLGINTNQTSNNPYYVAQYNQVSNRVENVIGRGEVSYTPVDWITLSAAAGTNFFYEDRLNIVTKGTKGNLNGQFTTQDIFRREVQTDLIARINRQLSSDLTLNVILGHQINQRSFRRNRLNAQQLSVKGLYNYANAANVASENRQSLQRLYGVYGDISLDYKGWLNLNVTGRNDWTSTLPKSNNSYFYPSVNTSFIFTDALKLQNAILSYGKLRANWANVGSDTDPYQLLFTYQPAADLFTQFLSNNTFPHGGQLAFQGPITIPPGDNLKPQNQVEWEIGTELGFFDGRITLEANYYDQRTEDQIIAVSIPQSTGFDNKFINAGTVQNRGFEALLAANPFRSESGWSWDFLVNFSTNRQTVKDLPPDLTDYNLTSGFSGLSVRAAPGESFGLYGNDWQRDPNGNIIINPNSGLPLAGDGRERLGNIFPDWMMGINNTLTYKGISLGFLVDIRQGGVIFSRTVQGLRGSGLAAETLVNRGETFVVPGVLAQQDAGGNVSYVPNTVPVPSMQQFWEAWTDNSITSTGIFDASYIKLREIRLGYTLPTALLSPTFIKKVDIGVEARNVWIIKDHVPHIDPELNFFGNSLNGEGVEFYSVPSTRSIGFNVRVTL
ncbi:TonB-linked outer membrane protein, SusC/RagA family [Catalinimonas alkaloidigena]|uniref:TonB-linked outer membrane protein, SusC/RagA family n=1 Tax=Catalinimonas alkaloidigena TaxID=1075417 RepID=A0A1G9QNP6_9BACT|nr:SusC/RagA family TonB-linked outer membrane protein [Catalinimonas alkaloidigena]SDM12652.1 TonB-linked outer membrane protein, SusC/RagA family [Catalinimonas alkaloidigena]